MPYSISDVIESDLEESYVLIPSVGHKYDGHTDHTKHAKLVHCHDASVKTSLEHKRFVAKTKRVTLAGPQTVI